jgi:dipeptidyl aminopeptidase/acylaminoacyl peptidase
MPTKRPLKAEDLYDLQFTEDPQFSPAGQHIAFVKVTIDKIGNKYERHIWLASLTEAKPRLRQFTFGSKSDTSPRWSPDGNTLAFVSARNGKAQIFLIGLDGGEARAITSLPNGVNGLVWSADGKRIAFNSSVSAEERQKEDDGKSDPPPATALEAKHRDEIKEEAEKLKADPKVITRFPYRTGTSYLGDRYTHIYVVDVPAEGDKAKPYRVTDGELSFNDFTWSPDGKYLYTSQARDPENDAWGHQDLVRLNATGKRKPFVRLTKPGHTYFAPQPSPDGQWLAFIRGNEKGSWGHSTRLCIRPTTGGSVQSLITEFDRAVDVYEWSADSQYLYFQANDQGGTGVYRVAVATGRIETLVVGGLRMVQGFSVSKAGEIAFTANSPQEPSALYLRHGKRDQRITNFNDKVLAQIEIAETEEMPFKSFDGREIQGWLLKPIGFKKGKKYPLAVNMHGGPHVMWGPSMPGMWIEWQTHAANGYAVFYCNPRGSDGYGSEFATIIQSAWGEDVMKDVLTGVDEVLKRGFVDKKRLALTGGSYAGYMTAWITAHDPRFACAWSQRGLYSLLSFYGTSDIPHLVEREFDLEFPHDDFEKSWRHSPLAYAKTITTPLAIEHQENDYRCPISEAEQLFTVLKKLKREVMFVRYPREGHEMSRGGEPLHRVDRLNRMVGWFDKWCKK